jgi:PAS domain S-box-containing protein
VNTAATNPPNANDLPSVNDAVANERVKILLVDDNEDNLISLEAALEVLGEDLILARSGRQALRELLEHDFAAILLDVKMPEMDGFEAAELIRARKRSQHTPILFLTGYRNEEHLFRGYDLGAVDFLFKPIVPEVLRSKVAVFVALSRSAQRQRIQAEILAKAEQRFRSLLNAAPDAMLITKESGEIVLANSRTDTMFGYSRSGILGHDIRKLIPEWCPETDSDPRPWTAVRNDGTPFPAEVSSSPLLTDEGLLVTSAVRDISERRRNEQRIEDRNQQLAALNQELEAFSYSVSHDLRAPLRSIEGFSKILLRDYSGQQLDETASGYLERMRAAAGRMGQLIEDLLELSRVSRTELSLEIVDLSKAAASAAEDLRQRDPERCVTVSIEPGITVLGDSRLLAVVLSNLLGNAWKFTGNTADARVELKREKIDGIETFRVNDNGAGFNPEFSDKLFAPFQRLHRVSEFEGTGVGLAIVQRVIQRHNGRIWAESKVGEGATFYFTLNGDAGTDDGTET